MLVAISTVAFVSTNIDNLLMLSALLAMSSSRPLPVISGFLLATLLVIGTALLIARLGDFVDTRYVGLLGLIPIALGLRGLMTLVRNKDTPAETQKASPGVWRAAAIILPMSGDSVAVYVPLIADTAAGLDAVAAGTLFAAAVITATAAQLLVSRPALSTRVEWLGKRLMPWLMIGVGVYVLADTPGDVFLG